MNTTSTTNVVPSKVQTSGAIRSRNKIIARAALANLSYEDVIEVMADYRQTIGQKLFAQAILQVTAENVK